MLFKLNFWLCLVAMALGVGAAFKGYLNADSFAMIAIMFLILLRLDLIEDKLNGE